MPYRNERDALLLDRERLAQENERLKELYETDAMELKLLRRSRKGSSPWKLRATLTFFAGYVVCFAMNSPSPSPLHPPPADVAAGGGDPSPQVEPTVEEEATEDSQDFPGDPAPPKYPGACVHIPSAMKSAIESSLEVKLTCEQPAIIWPESTDERVRLDKDYESIMDHILARFRVPARTLSVNALFTF